MARPVVPLLHLVQNRRFDARNKRRLGDDGEPLERPVVL